MESLDSGLTTENNFSTTPEIKSYLLEAAKWGKFLAIMGYIGIGLMLLIAAGVMVAGNLFTAFASTGMSMSVLGAIYIAIAAFYFFPVYYMHQFSIKIKQGLNSQSADDITGGFQNLKSLFKFMGIFTIVILSFYGIAIVVAVIAGVASKI